MTATAVIEHAFRRCGKLASTISSELQLSAKENLFFLLSDLANRGISLWCIQKNILAVTPNQITFDLPRGTVDVHTTLYRTKTDLAGDTISGAGYQGIDLGDGLDDAVYTVTLGFTAAATTPTIVLESSADNVTWTALITVTSGISLAAGALVCADSDNSTTARYWRVRDTSGTLATVSTLTFSTDPMEVPMAKLSNDDYTALPNKAFAVPTGSKSLQFWYDKQINPRIWIWPASQGSIDQIVVWTHRQIQDVGALTNTLEIPQRWLESVILTLACRCALELPAGELPPGRYELLSAEAERHLVQAENSESDGAPIRLTPRIACYSR